MDNKIINFWRHAFSANLHTFKKQDVETLANQWNRFWKLHCQSFHKPKVHGGIKNLFASIQKTALINLACQINLCKSLSLSPLAAPGGSFCSSFMLRREIGAAQSLFKALQGDSLLFPDNYCHRRGEIAQWCNCKSFASRQKTIHQREARDAFNTSTGAFLYIYFCFAPVNKTAATSIARFIKHQQSSMCWKKQFQTFLSSACRRWRKIPLKRHPSLFDTEIMRSHFGIDWRPRVLFNLRTPRSISKLLFSWMRCEFGPCGWARKQAAL